MAEYIVKNRTTGEVLAKGDSLCCADVIGCDYAYIRQLARTDHKTNSKYSMYKVERIGAIGKRGGAHRKDVNCLGCGVLMKNVSTSQKRCPECARLHKNAYYREQSTRHNEDGLVANRYIKRMNQDGCEGCAYLYGEYTTNRCCNYLLVTGKRRPCPPGAECTVKIERKGYREKEK